MGQGKKPLTARFGGVGRALRLRSGRGLLFFGLFYLYLWMVVDLKLIHHGGGRIMGFPEFYVGWGFLGETVRQPGGLAEYVSAFLSQLFQIGWLGALVVTIEAYLIFLCSDSIIKAVKNKGWRWISYTGPILLLIIYGRYAYQFGITVVVLLSLFLGCLYLRVSGRDRFLGAAAVLVLSVVAYLIAEEGYLLLLVTCGIVELFFRKRATLVLLCAALGAIVPYAVGVLGFGISVYDVYGPLLPQYWGVLEHERQDIVIAAVYGLCLSVPAVLAASGLRRSLGKRSKMEQAGPEEKPEVQSGAAKAVLSALSLYRSTPAARWLTGTFILLAAGAAAGFLSHDGAAKGLLEVDYCVCHDMWSEALNAAEGREQLFFVNHAVDRALYHRGRLAEDMFAYPQNPHALLLTTKEYGPGYWQSFGLYGELGQLNMAEHGLTQCLELFGEHPLILRRLALISMAKGELGAARIYLGVLSKTLFDSGWAETYLEKIKGGAELTEDEQVAELRSVCAETNRGFNTEIEVLLLDLLEKNGQNQMAYEYLMAHYLLTRQLDKFAANLWRLDDIGYEKLPRSYEEAILLYTSMQKEDVDLGGRQISLESHRRYDRLVWTLNRYRGNKQAAFGEMARDLGDSYFFYFLYGRSGMRR